jgi:hypothetical protein
MLVTRIRQLPTLHRPFITASKRNLIIKARNGPKKRELSSRYFVPKLCSKQHQDIITAKKHEISQEIRKARNGPQKRELSSRYLVRKLCSKKHQGHIITAKKHEISQGTLIRKVCSKTRQIS